MATKTWNGTAGNWSDGTKWSGGTKPAAGDDVIFNTGSGGCTVDEAPASLNSFSMTSGHTGTFTGSTYNFTVASTVSIGTGGAFSSSGVWTQTGDANFSLNSNGAMTVTSMQIDLQGTGSFLISKASAYINKLTCAASGKTTTWSTTLTTCGISSASSNQLVLGTGTLTLGTSTFLIILPKATCTPISNSGATISGAGTFLIRTTGASYTITVSALTLTGTTNLQFDTYTGTSGATVYTMGGNISTTGNLNMIENTGSLGTVTYNTGNYSIVAATFYTGSSVAGAGIGTFYNFGSSAITIDSFSGSTYNSASSTLNFSTSTWTCKGNWVFGTNNIVTNTSASITFNTNNATLTTASKTFPSLIFNESGKTYTHSGALTCASLTVTNGIFTQAAAITVNAGNASFAGSDTLTLNSTFTMSNSGSSFTVTNSGTKTTTALVLTLTQNMTLNPGTLTISRLVLTAGKTYTFTATTCVLTVNSYTAATDWQGTSGNVITWVSSSPGTQYKVNNSTGSIIITDYVSVTDCDSSGGNRPCMAKTGSTLSNDINWYRANVWSASGASTWNTAGNWSLSHVPTSTEIAYFDNTSVQGCTVNVAPSIAGLLTTTGYTGAFSDAGYAFTVVSTITLNTAGTLTLTGTWTQTGEGDFTLNSTTTVTATSMQVVLQGSGVFAINKASAYINKLTCAASGKTTTINGVASSGVRGGAGIFNLGTGTLVVTQNPWRVEATSTAACMTNSGATIQPSGSGSINFSLGAASVTHTLPAISTCSAPITMHNSASGGGTGTIDMGGAINSTSTISIFGYAAGVVLTFNTNNYNITCGTFTIGAYGAGYPFTANFGSSVLTVSGFTYQSNTAATINLNTSTWYCDGNWTNAPSWTFNAGTSLVSIARLVYVLGSITVTTGNQSFYDFDVNVPYNNIYFTGNLIALGDFTVTNSGGVFSLATANPSLTVYGNTTITNVASMRTAGCIFYGNVTVITGPVLFASASTGYSLYFYGNITLNSVSYVYNYTTTYTYLAATSGTQEITMNGSFSQGLGTVIHNGAGGTVKLMSSFKAYKLTLTAGAFNQNGQTISIGTATGLGYFTWNSSDTGTIIDGTINVEGACSRGASSAGTITGTIVSGPATALTSNGKSWYNLTTASTAYALSLTDACICNNITAGYIITNGYSVTCNTVTINNSATLNITNTTLTVLGDFIVAATSAPPVFTVTGATLIFGATSGTQTISSSTYGISFPPTTFNTNLTVSNAAGLTFNRLTFGVDGKTLKLTSGRTYTITNLAQADWQGSSGARNVINSSIVGTRATLAIPNALPLLSYMNVKDNALTGYTITADDGTSINGGNNNSNWIFGYIRRVPGFTTLQDPGIF